jgi:hypothetical protein
MVAELAERIDRRAQQGLSVHLKPETARTVAMTMRLYAEGHGGPSTNARTHSTVAERGAIASGRL